MSHAITYRCKRHLESCCDECRDGCCQWNYGDTLCPTCCGADTTPPEPQRDDAMWYARALELRNALEQLASSVELTIGGVKGNHLYRRMEAARKLISAFDAGEPPAAWVKMMRIRARLATAERIHNDQIDTMERQHAMIRELRDALDEMVKWMRFNWSHETRTKAEQLLARVDAGEPPAAWAKMQDALSAARHAAGWFAEHAGDCGEGACKDAHEDLEAKLNALEEAT